MDTFGKRLTECRKAKNLSQKELAEAFVTSHTTIGKYKRDEIVPSIDAAKKLAKILDTSVGYLLGRMTKPIYLKTLKCCSSSRIFRYCLKEKKKVYLLPLTTLLKLQKLVYCKN